MTITAAHVASVNDAIRRARSTIAALESVQAPAAPPTTGPIAQAPAYAPSHSPVQPGPTNLVPRVVRTWQLGMPMRPEGDRAAQSKAFRLASLYHACVQEWMDAIGQAPFVVTLNGVVVGEEESDLDSEAPTDPLARLLLQPNPEMSPTEWRQQWLGDLCTYGQHFTRKVRSAAGMVVQLHPLRADLVEVVPMRGGLGVRYFYGPEARSLIRRAHTSDGFGRLPAQRRASRREIIQRGWEEIQPRNMIHFKFWNPDCQWTGLSPAVTLHRENVLDDASIGYLVGMNRNGGIPGAILTTEQELEPEDRETLGREFMERYGWRSGTMDGTGVGRPAVLDRGVSAAAFGLDPSRMDTSGTTRVSESRTCAVLKTPMELVGAATSGDSSNAYKHYTEVSNGWWFRRVIPRGRWVRDELGQQLINYAPEGNQALRDFAPGYRLSYDISRVPALSAAWSAMTADATLAWHAGGITLNEYRQGMGKRPLPPGHPRGEMYADELGLIPGQVSAEPREDAPAVQAAINRALASATARVVGDGGGNGHAIARQ